MLSLRRVAVPQPRMVAAVFGVVCLLFLDASLVTTDPSGIALMSMGLIMLGLAVAALRYDVPVIGVALTAVALSCAFTYVLHETVAQRTFGVTEFAVLLGLLVGVCRSASRVQAFVVGAALSVTIMVLQNRISDPWVGAATQLPIALLVLGAVIAGAYMRGEDTRRAARADRVRRFERLELARDLHDHVANFMTAVVVQAQTGQELVRDEMARKLFTNIEQAGQDGLVAMRRMVHLLREHDDGAGPAPRRETPGIEQIKTHVEQFARGGARADLDLDPDLDLASLPPELATTVQRVVQEGLTNVLKHVRNPTGVRVLLSAHHDTVRVAVRNDGAAHGRRGRRFASSGFGLLGLSERVEGLGGELYWGAQPEGGWELSASLPRS
ncbi:sensor histidine kinase [Actinoallomurus sp. CA-150999]|uniref:sensor histidine kinase n=1 Tax=Actinoallomurus sp. CA-150999 TaxID=3239887 RepID=UPI003D939B0A